MERRLEELEKENQILKAEIEDLKRGKRTFKNAFAKALNQVADSVMAISADGRLLYANKHYVRIHGLDEDWSHYTIYDLPISFNTPIAFLRKIVEIKNAPGGVLTYTCEYRNEYEKKNGILKVSAVILEHEGEDTMWFFGMDVTELVRSRNKLKESNLLLQAIMDKYASTDAGNLAYYQAGLCNYQLGKTKEAIKCLEEFSPKGDNTVSAQALFALANCYASDKQIDKAIDTFKKAAKETDVPALCAEYLFQAGVLLESQKKNNEALEIYQQIKADYPTAPLCSRQQQGNVVMDAMIDKYIDKLSK